MKIKKSVSMLAVCLFAMFILAACDVGVPKEHYDIEVTVGEEFDITLDSPGSDGGYSWKFHMIDVDDNTNSDILFINEEHISIKHDPDVVGSPTKCVYTFQVIDDGNYEIRFEYRQWWEKDVPAEKIVIYKITATYKGENS